MTNLEKTVKEYEGLCRGGDAGEILIAAAIKDLTDVIRELNITVSPKLPGLSKDSYTKPSGRGGPSEF